MNFNLNFVMITLEAEKSSDNMNENVHISQRYAARPKTAQLFSINIESYKY